MKSVLLVTCCFIMALGSSAQYAFMSMHTDDYARVERWMVMQASFSDTLWSGIQPYTQKDVIRFVQKIRTQAVGSEAFYMDALLAKEAVWMNPEEAGTPSRHPVLKTLYKYPADLLRYVHNDYSLSVNPVIQYEQMLEAGGASHNLYINSRGAELQGQLLHRVGFYTVLTDNQERGPSWHQMYVQQHQAIPGATYYKDLPGQAQDYFSASGYIDVAMLKEHMNLSFGSNRFQLGEGYRSLFLSDFGSNMLFLRLNTRVGKVNYQNLFLELTPQYLRGADHLLPRKYAAIHHLSMHVAPWMQLGLYESVVFGRNDFFDFQYLNPVIFYHAVEQTKGSPDNSMLGVDLSIQTRFRIRFYSQFLLDEFKFSHIKAGDGWWGNKYAWQLGLKIADPFGIPHLLIQPEVDLIRPYTYTHNDSVAEFSHYNQSLAHPYGANLLEYNLNLYYQPFRKISLQATAFYNKQGRDTSAQVSFGGNIFKSNTSRNADLGIGLFNGFPSTVFLGRVTLSYEWRPRFYIDLGAGYRKEEATNPANPTYSRFFLQGGIRWNAVARHYDY